MATAPAPLPGDLALLAALAACAAAGSGAGVREAAALARSHAVREPRLREVLRLVVPYAGYPRALAAFAAARPGDAGPEERAEAPPEARAAAGVEAFAGVYGPGAPRVRAALEALAPPLPAWTLEHAYGRVIARPGLTLRERELLAVALLTALWTEGGGLDDPLLGHMRGALRQGASPEQVAAAVEAVPEALGAARKAAARALLTRLGA